MRYAPVHQFWWFDLGLPSVLIFPVLSGYVIGLTTTGPAKAPHVRTYLSRHFRRLVPLNTAAVILTFAGSPLTFAVRLLLHVALTSVVTWWLERRFVPGLRNHFPPRAPLG